jgi:hypothetical protein
VSIPAPTPRWRQAASSAGFYLLAGPPVATLAVLLALSFGMLLDGEAAWAAAIMLAGAPLFLLFGYIFGAVPAAVIGFAVGWHRHRIRGWIHVLLAALAGALVAGLLFQAAYYGFGGSGRLPAGFAGTKELIRGIWIGGAPGFVAALFCAWRQLRNNQHLDAAATAPA